MNNTATTSCQLSRFAACALMLVLAYIPAVQAAKSLSVGTTVNGSNWKGDNGSGNSDFESDRGGQLAASVSYRVDKFYTGLNLQGGTYDFGSDAPSQFASNGTATSSDVKVEHSDFDLLAGYYFWSNISLFLDLKVTHSEWRDTGYEQAFAGLGLGVSGFHSLNDKWLLFGSFGFVNGDIDDNDDRSSHGDGTSTALVGGAVYRLDKSNTFNFGIKLRNYEFDFDDGNDQEYSLNGLFFGYNHNFNFN
ncbi:MAG: hypothetical protein GY935_21440 [Gammaproteobacteria bacterium]|nr:hypothetical protein [Gammaproteobacteria bacterium]